ncbi:uncharacterized protein LOC125508537 isoform X2 [Triticum urartu]|nr:uncharacterized protein LOC125508537 isoform X2 [Triticum urartu]
MLVSAPYKAPEKKAKGRAKVVWSGPRHKGALDATSEDKTSSSVAEDDDDEEQESDSPPDGGRKKRAASAILEAEAPKKGKGQLVGSSAWDVDNSPERCPRTKPQAASPAHDSSQRSSSRGSLDSRAMASESPPAAYSPKAKGDAELLSRRTFPSRGRLRRRQKARAPSPDTRGSQSLRRLVVRAVFSSALSRIRFRRLIQLRSPARNLLRKKGVCLFRR